MKDVICGMAVDASSPFSSEYKGKAYYFCSAACKQSFDKEPARYAKG